MSDRLFYLKQKDYNVAVLLINDDGEMINARIIDPERVPFIGGEDVRQIYRWWKDRAIPEGREHLSELLKEHGCVSPQELLFKNLGLSLTDTYWICPEEYTDLSFGEVNLFDNGKDNIGFHESPGKMHYTPNASLGGTLEKIAIKEDDGWYLEKTFNSKYPDGQQNVNELFISKLHELQGWNEYVKYTVSRRSDGICDKSRCRYFTSIEKELISAFDLTGGNKPDSTYRGSEEFRRYIRQCVIGGLDEEYVRRSLDYMIAMDYVTTNSDRHWLNFGALRDPDSLRLISLAPIYDHGNSMFFDSPYRMSRVSLVRLENTGIEKFEIDRLKLIHDKTLVKADLLPSPSEVKQFYTGYGLPEERADQIAESYSNKLDLFLEYQHGIQISLAREMDEYIYGAPYVGQKPNKKYQENPV